jgi:UDP-3-O-[3-hydroxymyristoyl] glucosamine N-acyltransferase
MSWRQYGGTQKSTISTVNAGSIVANQFLSRSTAANINQFDNLKVKGQLLSQDFIQSGTYIQALGQLITSGNLFVKDSLFFGTDASRVNLPWTYITGNPTGISINNERPEAALHITGLSFEVLKVDTSMNYIRNIIGQNVNARGVVIAADDASSNIYFYNDVSTNTLNKADSFIKNQPGSGLTIGSSSASVISLDNQGNVLISAAGTLSLFSTTGKFNISSNSTTLQSYLIVANRKQNYDAKYNESAIIYDNSNVTYLRNVYDVSSALTGNSLSLLAIDNSSNTFLRFIDPSGSGFAVGGGAFPADTNRSFGSMFLSDFSGNYILSQNIVSGNYFHKYASTTGINTFIPKTENYVLDINGPTRIGNGELKTVFNANFEFKQVQFSKKNPNFGMAVGSSSSTGTLVGNNIVYLQYFSFTNDKGKTWNTLPIDIDVNSFDNFEQRSDNTFNSLYVYDINFAILGTNNSSLYYTINGGLNWALLIYNSTETSSLVFRNTTNIYAESYIDIFRVFLSFDYTNNTNNSNNSPKYNTFYFTFNPYNPLDPIVSSGYIGYLTSNQTYNIQNYFTYNINPVTNTITYSNIGIDNYSYEVNAVDSSGQYMYLAGDGIIKVDVSNSIPTSIYNRQNAYLSQYNGIYVYDNSNVIAVGNNILSWTNDGTNWTDLSLSAINIGNVNLQSVFIYDLSRAVAVGSNGVFIYTNEWQNSTWSIVPHELLNSSGIGSRIDGSNNQLRNIYMHSIDLFLISNVTSSFIPNTYSGTTVTSYGSYGASRLLYAYYPSLYNRINNTILELSGNMFMSGDLNINDGGKLMSNNSSFNLLNNNNIQSIYIGNDETINNMAGSLFIGYDLSVNSRMFVVNDVCMNSRLFIGADVSMNGNVYSGGRSIIQGDVSMNSRLFIDGDVSMNSRLFVTSDVSFGSRLFVGGDASLNSRLFVTSDVSFGSRLFVNGDVSMNSRLFVTSDVSMGARLFINGDVSMNSRVSIGSDTYIGGDLTVQKDVLIVGRLNVLQYAQSSIIYTNVTTNNYSLIISEDMSLNGRLFVNDDAYIKSRLFTDGDVSMNGNVYYYGRTIKQGDVSMNSQLFVNGDVSMNSRLFVTSDASMGARIFVLSDSSFGGNLYAQGRTINQGDVSMNSRLFVYGDVSMNSRLFVTSDVSMGARIFVLSDSSFGGNFYAQGRTINQGDVSMNSKLFVNGDVSLNSRLFITSDVSMNARLFVSNDVSFGNNLYAEGRTIIQGDVSMNSRLFINGDVSMNSRLFISSDVSMNARLFVSNDVSFNGNLYANFRSILNGDAVLNNRLFVANDVSMNNNVGITKNLTVYSTVYSAYYDICSNLYNSNPNYPNVANQPGVADSITIGNSAKFINIGTGQGEIGSTRTITIGAGNQTSSSTVNTIYLAGANDNLVISGKLSAQNFNLTTIAIPAFVFNSTQNNTTGTTDATNYGSSFSKIKANASSISSVANIADNIGWLGAGFAIQDASLSTAGFFTVDSSGSGFLMKAPASNNIVQMYTDSLTYGATNFGNRSNIRNGILVLTTDFSLNSPINGNPLIPYSITVKPIDISNIFLRDDLVTDPSFQRILTSVCVVGDVSMNSRLFVFTDVSFTGNMYALGRSILQGDVSMNSRLFVGGDVSFNSRLFVTSDVSLGGRLFVGGDVSLNSRLFITSDVSLGGRLFVGGDVSLNSRLFITSDVSLGARLFVGGDVSFNSRLFITSDVSLGGRLFVGGDVSLNSRLFITSDVSLGGRLFVGGDVSFNSRLFVTSDVSLGGRLFVGGDVSLNSRLFVTSDVSMNARLFVSGDSSYNGNLYTLGRTIKQGDVSMNSRLFINGDVSMNSRLFVTNDVSMGARLFVGGDVSFNSRLFVTSDVSMNARLFVSGDASYNGNLYTLERTIQQGDVSMNSRLFINGDVSMNSRLFVTSDVSLGGRLFVGNDVIITGRLSVFEYQQRYVLYTNVTQTQYTMIVHEDLSLNGRLNVNFDASMNARLFLSDDASFNANMYLLGRSINQGDVSMNSRLFVNGDVSMNSRLFVTSDVSMGARLFVLTDASFGGNMYGFGRTIKQGDVSMNSRLFVNGDVSLNSRLFVTSDVSMGARLFVLTDASFGGNMYAFGRTIEQGDVSMNSRLFINGDVSMNSRLFVTSDVSMGARLFVLTDASFGGNIYAFGRSIQQGDVSMNSRLFVKGDVSMNSRLFVTSDVSMGGRLFVGGDVSMNSRLFLTSDASFGARLFVKTDASFGGNMFIANKLFLGVSGNPYQVDLSGVINLRGTVNPITLIDDSVLLTNTPPLDFSNNYGSAWTPIYGITDETLNSISMSANGQYQTVVTTNASNLGFIYTSADYGFSWKKNANVTNKFWTAVSVSANGKYQSATVYLGNIWTNTNYGLGSWNEYTTGVYNYLVTNVITTVLSTQHWLSISMSSTGQYQTAITNTFPSNGLNGGDLYISSNYGTSWDIGSSLLSGGQTGSTGLPGYNPFNGITMSSTGQYQATVVYNNFIYVSNDFGKKWIAVTNTTQQFFGISMSSSGQYITTVTSKISLSTTASFMSSDRGTIFRSSNYGLSWNDSAVNNYWNAITMTANGQYQTAVVNNSAKTYSGLFSIVSGSNLVSTVNALSYPAIILGSAVSGTGIPSGTVVTSNPVLANGNTIYQFYISNNVTETLPSATLTFQSGAIYSSSNYGVTWYDNTIKNTNGISNTMSQIWQSQGIAMSANGQYQTALAGGVGGYIYTSMTPYQQVLISNNLTVMSGDTTIYTRLFVINDVSMTSRLFVTSDVSLNARLFVGGDASYNGNLYTLGRTILQGDVSMNSRLFVNGDVSLNSRLFIASTQAATSTSTGALTVGGGAGIGGNLYVGGLDSYINGNVSLGNNGNCSIILGHSSNTTANARSSVVVCDGGYDGTTSYGALGIVRQPNDITRSHLALIQAGNFVWNIHYPVNSNALVFGTANAIGMNASFTGSISDTVLTVTAVASGTIGTNSILTGTSIPTNTVIISRGTGTGATGTYNLNKSLTIASQALFATTLANVNLGLNGGYVGIGTPNPYSMLSLYSAIYSNAAAINFNNPSNNSYTMQLVDNAGSNYLRLGRDGFGDLVVNNNGNIGINTSSPGYKLHVNGTQSIASITTMPYTSQIVAESTSGRLYLGYGYTSGTGSRGYIQASEYYSSTENRMPLLLNPNGGNVGIGTGTANPDFPLDISGGFKYASTAGALTTPSAGALLRLNSVANVLGSTIGNYTPVLNLSSQNGDNSFLNFYNYRYATGSNWTTASTRIQQTINNTNQGYIEFNPPNANNGIGLYANSSTNLNASALGVTIFSTGNVSINTTSSTSTLNVGGGITIANGNTITSTGDMRLTSATNTSLFLGNDKTGGNILVNYSGGLANTTTAFIVHGSDGTYSTKQNFTILNNGNVGIGTNNPIAQLHLYSTLPTSTTAFPTNGHLIVDCARSGAMGGTITVRNSGGANTAGSAASIAFEFDGSTSYGNDGTDSANARIACINEGGVANAGALAFNTWNGTAQGERMRISGAGNVGIGTTAPGSALSFGNTINNKILTLYDEGATDSVSGAIAFYGFGINANTLRYQVPVSQNHAWYNGSTNVMSLDTGGNLLAKSTTISTSKTSGSLQVAGGAGISGNLYANNLYSTGGLYISTWSQPLINGTSTPQGAYMGWNYSNGGGETNFVNCKGTGGGGFNFYNIATGASSTFPNPVVTITGVGDASFNGNVTIGGTLKVYQLQTTAVINTVVVSTKYSLLVSEDSSFNGNISIMGTQNSTSTTNGALTVSGGAGIANNLYVGGGLNVASGSTLSGALSAGASTLSSLSVTTGSTLSGALSAGATTLSSLSVTNGSTLAALNVGNITTTGYMVFPSATATNGGINFATGTNTGLTWGANYSRIYDDGDLRICTDDTMHFHRGSTGTLVETMSISSAGVVSILATTTSNATNVGALTVAGGLGVALQVNATSFNAASDYRIKDNIVTLDETYIVDNLRPVRYHNKTLDKDDIGLIAHELQDYYPYLVSGEKDGENHQGVNYNGLIGILINEIKNMKKEIKQLRSELDEIKNK